jgi:hypothetical protein
MLDPTGYQVVVSLQLGAAGADRNPVIALDE